MTSVKRFLNKQHMSKSHILLAMAVLSATMTSCFKDEPLNTECDIEQAFIHAADPSTMFVKLSDSIASTNESARVVTFDVRKGTDLTALAPQFIITPGATISPESGSIHDFSTGGVTYTVTSEDRAYSKSYSVRFNDGGYFPEEMDFENFFLEPDRQKYYIWTDLSDNGARMLNWASGNAGFSIVGAGAAPEEYPTAPWADGYEGNAVVLTTRSTGAAGAGFKMPIAAGNLFTGSFNAKTATIRPLESTHFGDGPYCVTNRKPLKFSGYYQYTPGPTVTNRKGDVVEGTVDQGDIYAVLFKNTKADGTPFYLDGTNVKTSPQIVALALAGPVDATKGGWQAFNVDFKYIADFDPQLLHDHGYSIAVVFTSSTGGAGFVGAVGSRMLVDKVRITME